MPNEVFGLIAITATGMILALIFDLLRSATRVFHTPAFISDILFWILATGAVYCVILYFNNGRLRGYHVAGVSIGAILYFLTISNMAVYAFTVIFKIFLKFLRYIFKILLTPAVFLYKILIVHLKPKTTKAEHDPTSGNNETL